MKLKHRNILIVDDDIAIRRLFRTLLSRNYTVREAHSGEEAIEVITLWSPDLVLLDIMMPGIDGYETCRQLRASSVDNPPQVIMVSSKSATAEQARAFEVGADDYLVKPIDPVELRSRVELHFRLRESQAGLESLRREVDGHHQVLKRTVQERIEQTLAIQDVAVFTLAKMAESRDKETGEHIERMREYSQRLAQELQYHGPYADKIDDSFLADLYRSSPLHDIGKVGIPDAILFKPGLLTPEEFKVMQGHAMIGGNILNEAVMQLKGGGFLAMATLIAQFHHERWDGGGYPAGLVGDEIPLPARIVSVADVFDALTTARPYKDAWSPDRAKRFIDEAADTQFDPLIVAAFNRCYEDILHIQHAYADPIQTSVGAMCFLEYDLLETV
ncbi:MAG: response regulator [Planctomycetota bacterium]|nr:response regulator [Planctomycetota bacterium]